MSGSSSPASAACRLRAFPSSRQRGRGGARVDKHAPLFLPPTATPLEPRFGWARDPPLHAPRTTILERTRRPCRRARPTDHPFARTVPRLAARAPFRVLRRECRRTLNLLEAARRLCPEVGVVFMSTNKLAATPRVIRGSGRNPWNTSTRRREASRSFDRATLHLFGSFQSRPLMCEYGRYFPCDGLLRAAVSTGRTTPRRAPPRLPRVRARAPLRGPLYRCNVYRGSSAGDLLVDVCVGLLCLY